MCSMQTHAPTRAHRVDPDFKLHDNTSDLGLNICKMAAGHAVAYRNLGERPMPCRHELQNLSGYAGLSNSLCRPEQ